jgi:hypothetical protein
MHVAPGLLAAFSDVDKGHGSIESDAKESFLNGRPKMKSALEKRLSLLEAKLAPITNPIMFPKIRIFQAYANCVHQNRMIELHDVMHQRLDLLLRHVATVPDDLAHKPISGFCHPSIWKQLVHILTCEEGWVHDLQNKAFAVWREEDCPTMAALEAAKGRIQEATRTYVGALTEEQLNTTLTQRPVDWGGELRDAAFILLHA